MPSALLAVAGKELREHAHSRRFQIALAVGTLLMVTSTATLALSYREDEAAWQVAQAELEGQGDVGPFASVAAELGRVLRKPNALAIFAGGPGDAERRDGGALGFDPRAQGSGGSGSPTNARFAALDLGFVAVVVMTLMAVLFAYDAVSGERERGTLKLMLANPLPRDTVLLGKYLGGMASVALPFGVSLLAGLAVFQGLGVHLAPDEWLRLGLIVVLFLPLASAFYLLGLLVSSLARRSSTSLLALLLVWLVLVFGVGSVAAAVAKSATDVTTDAEVLQGFQAIREEEQEASAALHDELFALYNRPNATEDPVTRARIEEVQRDLGEVYKASQARREAMVAAARRGLDAQLQAAEGLAALSPAEAYRNLATALARSDHWSWKHASEAAEAYQREVERAREIWAEEQGMVPGGPVWISSGMGVITTPIGGGPGFEVPAFGYQQPGVAEQLGSARGVRDLAVLVAANLLAFVGAWVAFTRYDAR